MVPEDLLFWIIATDADTPADAKLLCRRHADAMVVPRDWTLDDRRQPTPSLFQTRRYDTKPITNSPSRVAAARRHVRHAADQAVEQLQIDGTGPIPRPDVPEILDTPEVAEVPVPVSAVEPVAESVDESAAEPDVEPAATPDVETAADGTNFNAWRPEFDISDDLDGLLETKSPLLSRAFRGTARQR